jgi:hypothetical protein
VGSEEPIEEILVEKNGYEKLGKLTARCPTIYANCFL